MRSMKKNSNGSIQNEENVENESEQVPSLLKNSRLNSECYLCMMTYIETRPIPAYSKQIIKHLQIIHTIVVYLQLSQQPLSSSIHSCYSWISQNQQIYRLVQVLVYIIDLTSILLIALLYSSIFFPSTKTKIVHFVVRNVPLWSEALLCLSSFLMTVSWAENLVLYVTSLFVYFYSNVMMVNDTNRTGVSFITSSMYNLYFCVIFALFYASNLISLMFSSQTVHEVSIAFWGMFYLFWFISCGYKMFLNSQFQRLLDMFIALILVIVIHIIQQKLAGSLFLSIDSIMALLLTTCIVSSIVVRYSEQRFQRSYHHFQSHAQSHQKLKQFELFLWSYQKGEIQQVQIKSFLKGLIKQFQKNDDECDNQFGVFTTKRSLYRNNDGEQETLRPPFDQILINYIHGQYEKMLKKKENKQIIIDYIDFMLNTSGNFYRLHLLCEKVQHLSLGVLGGLKMTKISLQLKKNIQKFNNQVYQHLDLDEIMECEDIFRDVLANINIVIEKNISIWKKVKSHIIDQTSIEANLKNIHQTIENIDQLWLKLSLFLKMNKKWLFIYLVYSLYIKNQRIKSYLLAEINEDDSFNQHEDITQNHIFNPNTFYLRCKMANQQLRILKISPNTLNLIDFCEAELIHNELGIILPEEIRPAHNEKVRRWLQKGQCNHQKSYRTINSYIFTKSNLKMPVKVIFTLHVDYISEHHFQFVALLKIKMKKQMEEEVGQGGSPHDALMRIDKRGEIVLDSRNNIFLKEKNLQPVKKHPEISFVKFVLGILVISLLLVNFIYGVTIYTELQALQGNVLSYFNFLNLYRFPMSIGKNYMKYFLNLGNQTKVVNQINVVYNQIVTFSRDPFTIETIFNADVNRPQIYYPFANNSFNLGVGLNQVDIFYEIMSNLASLSKVPISINRLGYEFNQFNMYIKPAYDAMINATKYRLNEKLDQTIQNNSDSQFIFGGMQCILIAAASIVIVVSIYRFLKHMERVMRIIFQLDEGKIRTIQQYWSKFQNFFTNIKEESENYERSIRKARNTAFVQQRHQNYTNSNLNKREKDIKLSNQHKKKIIIFFTLMLFLLLAILIFNLVIEFYAFANIEVLDIFHNAGFYFLRFYPVTSTLGHATLEKYYSVVYPNQISFHPQRFEDTMEALRIMGETDYIGSIIDESPYYRKQKSYLFSNPCAFDASVMMAAQVTMAQCLTYNNKSFTNGIISYINNIKLPVSNYLNGKMNMTYGQLDQLTASLSLVTYYITDIIQTWAYEFVDRITVFRTNIIIIACVVSSITVFLYMMVLIVVKNTLESAYNGVIYMLSYMMPESILLTEKITRQKLVTLKILKG